MTRASVKEIASRPLPPFLPLALLLLLLFPPSPSLRSCWLPSQLHLKALFRLYLMSPLLAAVQSSSWLPFSLRPGCCSSSVVAVLRAGGDGEWGREEGWVGLGERRGSVSAKSPPQPPTPLPPQPSTFSFSTPGSWPPARRADQWEIQARAPFVWGGILPLFSHLACNLNTQNISRLTNRHPETRGSNGGRQTAGSGSTPPSEHPPAPHVAPSMAQDGWRPTGPDLPKVKDTFTYKAINYQGCVGRF